MKQAVLAALDCDYRHIDCAAAYSNEPEVGQALSERLGEGKVPADQTIHVMHQIHFTINTSHT